MLAVVVPDPVPPERPGRAAQAGPSLQQDDRRPLVGGLHAGSEARQATTHHHHSGAAAVHGCRPEMLRTATRPFSQAGSETRSVRGRVGWAHIRRRSLRYIPAIAAVQDRLR